MDKQARAHVFGWATHSPPLMALAVECTVYVKTTNANAFLPARAAKSSARVGMAWLGRLASRSVGLVMGLDRLGGVSFIRTV